MLIIAVTHCRPHIARKKIANEIDFEENATSTPFYSGP
jgi:hypothetical protein